MSRKTSTETLADAMRILARDIQSGDGVANAAIAEAADRLAEQQARIAELEQQAAIGRWAVDMLHGVCVEWSFAGYDTCPRCAAKYPRHANNCELAAILRDAEQAGMGVEQ